MESIKELREICQGPRRDTDSWHMKHIARKPSIYITWALLHTPISANGVTFLMILIGLIASAIYMNGTKISFFIASIILQLWYVMDMVDGEVARYKKQLSLTGVYFDSISHYISHPFVFFGIGMGLYYRYGKLHLLLLSLLAAYSVCMITLLWDIFKSVVYEEANSRSLFSVINSGKGASNNRPGILKRIFSALHTICTFPAIMNILFLVSIINFFIPHDLMISIIIFYAVSATVVWTGRVFVFIKERKPDNTLSNYTGMGR